MEQYISICAVHLKAPRSNVLMLECSCVGSSTILVLLTWGDGYFLIFSPLTLRNYMPVMVLWLGVQTCSSGVAFLVMLQETSQCIWLAQTSLLKSCNCKHVFWLRIGNPRSFLLAFNWNECFYPVTCSLCWLVAKNHCVFDNVNMIIVTLLLASFQGWFFKL